MTDIVERLREQAWRRSGAPKMDAGHTKMLEWEAADEIERLRASLKECSDELESQIEGHYAQIKDHPVMKQRYDRDMEPVIKARKLLVVRKVDTHAMR